ncbi:hypothetical protein ES703_49494 [subsurface metagenome]
MQQAALTAEGEAPLIASPVAVVTSVQTGTVENVVIGIQELFALPIHVVSSVQASSCSLSWILVCEDLGIDPSRLEAKRVPISRQPLCRPTRRYT